MYVDSLMLGGEELCSHARLGTAATIFRGTAAEPHADGSVKLVIQSETQVALLMLAM